MAPGTYLVPIRDWPDGERPREKLAQLGAQLSDAELLAILLRTGVPGVDVVSLSQTLLASHGRLSGLSKLAPSELTRAHGLGPAKAATLLAALELGRRLLLAEGERPRVASAREAASLLEPRLRGLDQEQLHVMLLSTRNHVLGTRKIYEGSLNSSMVRPAEVFRDAIRENAAAIIVAHNHPSGDPNPSADDIRVTRDIVQAGRVLDIDVLDHLVIGDHSHGFVSLRERRLGFDAGA
ncbi:MAG TPA: DNA repair protein RadC [Chloroflexota bacterium]|nr:DNA repair protein RadC [Chloroflexota bacterium]